MESAASHPDRALYTGPRNANQTNSSGSLQAKYPPYKKARLLPWKRWKYTPKHADLGEYTNKRCWRHRRHCNWFVILLYLLGACAIVVLVWFALILALIGRLSPKMPSNGLSKIVGSWKSPKDSAALLSPMPEDFSSDIQPIPCASHNDYWRKVPLYDALLAGCTGVEADIWLEKQGSEESDLRVGHSAKSLDSERTLKSLYLDPLLRILEARNEDQQSEGPAEGVFETSSNTTLVLLLDFKSNGSEAWPTVLKQLEPLRQKGWLTTWTSTTNQITPGPLTVVASGAISLETIIQNTTHRDIFLDAPLLDLASPHQNQTHDYNSFNSFYASTSLSKAVGTIWLGRFSTQQLHILREQIQSAKDRGLRSRYWDTPSWPISWRNHVWEVLLESGTGMLSVDDLQSASRWDWDWCTVAGLSLCGM